MEKQYKAIITKSFTPNQAMPDIVKGRTYKADKDNEYFISEFADKVYLSQEKFDEHFKAIKITSSQKKAKRNYARKNKTLLLTFFPEDKDLLDWLDKKRETVEQKRESKGARGGRTEYIRQLIRKDMQRNSDVKN